MRRTLRRAGALAACFGGENPLEAWAAGWYYALAARRLSRFFPLGLYRAGRLSPAQILLIAAQEEKGVELHVDAGAGPADPAARG